jgi:hypothetical protein
LIKGDYMARSDLLSFMVDKIDESRVIHLSYSYSSLFQNFRTIA